MSDLNEFKIGKYKHFKGKEYQVISVAKHSETLEEYIIYQALYGEKAVWIRPKAMFLETIERDGKIMPRFEYIGD